MKRCTSCQTPYPDEFAFCPLDGAELDDPSVYAVGTTLRNKYRILARVGKGGMGMFTRRCICTSMRYERSR